MVKKLLYLCAASLMMLVSACSSNDAAADIKLPMLQYVSANADAVIVIEPKALATNASISVGEDGQLKLPSQYTEMLDSRSLHDLDMLNASLKDLGINYDKLVLALANLSSSKPDVLLVAKLDDKGKFVKKLKEACSDLQTSSADGVDYYTSNEDNMYIGIKDEYVLRANTQRYLERAFELDIEQSMAMSPMADKLSEGNVCVAYKVEADMLNDIKRQGAPTFLVNLFDGYICMQGNVDNASLKVVAELCDAQGNVKSLDELSKYCNMGASVDADALAYLNQDEMSFMAVAVENVNWDEIINEMQLSRSDRAAMSMAKPYLEKIQGTIAIGYGIQGGLAEWLKIAMNDAMPNPQDLPVTLVISVVPGKANSLVSDLKSLMAMAPLAADATYQDVPNGAILEVEGMTIHLQAVDDNKIIVSNRPIQKYGNCQAARQYNLGSSLIAFGGYLGRDNQVMRDLGLDYNISTLLAMTSGQAQFTLDYTLDGKGDGFLTRLIDIIIQINNQMDSIAVIDDCEDVYYATYDPDFDDVDVELIFADDDF